MRKFGRRCAARLPAATPARRPGTEMARLERASPVLLALLLVLAWDLTTRFGLIDPQDVSRPLDVFRLIWQWTVTGFIFPHFLETAFEVAAGYIGGTLAGMAVAFLF